MSDSSSTSEPSGPEPDPFDALLVDAWAKAPAIKELSAADRAKHNEAAAKAQARALKRDGRRARRRNRVRRLRGSARRYVVPVVFLALVGGAIYWQNRPRSTPSASSATPERQILIVEAIPSDGASDVTSTNEIRKIATDMREWFDAETGGSVPRIVSDNGIIRVKTVVLHADRALLETAAGVAFTLGVELDKAGLSLKADEAAIVFTPLRPNRLCGEATGRIAAIFRKACGPEEQDFRTNIAIVAAHELLHVMGAVQDCAPHYKSGAHTNGPPDDVMYEPTRNGPPRSAAEHLDPGHDDYYGTGRKDCLDIAKLPLWVNASQ